MARMRPRSTPPSFLTRKMTPRGRPAPSPSSLQRDHGMASAWLQLGAVGPWRVQIDPTTDGPSAIAIPIANAATSSRRLETPVTAYGRLAARYMLQTKRSAAGWTTREQARPPAAAAGTAIAPPRRPSLRSRLSDRVVSSLAPGATPSPNCATRAASEMSDRAIFFADTSVVAAVRGGISADSAVA